MYDRDNMTHTERMEVLGTTVRARMDANLKIADGMRMATNGDPSGNAIYAQGIADHKAASGIAALVRYN